MKYSIVIPTYNKLEEALKPCLISLLAYTDLTETEVLVVANGCTDGTAEYVRELDTVNVRLIEHEEALGYTKAANLGIQQSQGEYIVLLNNDTVLLPQPRNQWLEILRDPFSDPKVAITGPMKTFSPQAGRDFLIFFCVMIKAERFWDVGLLDEVFSPGYGEDTDWCCRAEDHGYSIKQVPKDCDEYYADKRMVGEFPIYHEGNVTFKNWPGGEDLLRRNNEILQQRYNSKDIFVSPLNEPVYTSSVNIDFAIKCDGYMSTEELMWLANTAKDAKIFIELGSWHGRSSRAIADNLPPEGILYCVDHWLGSKVERDTHHASAALEDGDHAYMEFCHNLGDHILSGKVIPIRMSGNNAAKFFSWFLGKKADVIFIDAGHTYEEVKEDIEVWRPLVKNGGILCGHDYYHDGTTWPGVQKAVDEAFGHKGTNMGYIPNNSIWRHVINYTPVKPAVYDCFPFNNELELLDRRFEQLYPYVDRFVIVEATISHSNKPKQLHFQGNLDRYAKYLHKVTHIVVDSYPATDSWSIERHQRDSIMRGLTECKPDDIIIISDVDEIPDPEVIECFRESGDNISNMEMDLFYYNEHTRAVDKWLEAKIARYNKVKELSPCGIRYCTASVPTIHNAGKHLSYFGDVDRIIEKIENTAHQEYNKEEYKNKDEISRRIQEGQDIFNRPNIKFERV